MTIRDLLRHTSGIIYNAPKRDTLGRLYREADVNSRNHTLASFSARLAKLPLAREPGTAWYYGLSTDLLGRVIEVAAGRPFDEFLSERIFSPLKMVDAAFFQPTAKAHRFAQPAGGLFDVAKTMPMLSGGAGLTMTTEDFFRFTMMLHNRGSLDGQRIIKPATLAEMTRNQIAGLDQTRFSPAPSFGFGLGFAVRILEKGPPGTVGAYGWSGYAGTYFWIDPAREFFVIFMMQDQFAARRFRRLIRKWVYDVFVD